MTFIQDDSWVAKLEELYFDTLMHFGVGHDEDPPGRGSGRYPYGTGDRQLQHNWEIYARIDKLKKSGMSEVEIAKALGFYKTDRFGNVLKDENGEPMGNSAMLRARASIVKDYIRNDRQMRAQELANTIDPDTGKLYTNKKIAEMLELPNESSVRNLLSNKDAAANANKTQAAADELKKLVDSGKLIDVGRGSELYLEISPDKMKVALAMLKEQGYEVQTIQQDQVGMNNGEKTWTKVLCPPGTTIQDVYAQKDQIKRIDNPDGESTATMLGIRDPVRVEKSRIDIKYKEDGGAEKDGVIEIRARRDENGNLVPVSEDLSLGNAKYAQVRIAVEGDKYIKGMAVYNTDLPEGVDILVNSNKSVNDGFDKALKDFKRDKNGNIISENPFGATVYQSEYEPGKLSAINIVGDIYGADKHQEGSWGEWSRNLPAQFLSKQSEALIQQQLKLKVQQKQAEYEEILSLNNPVVKKQMLMDFAESCDAAAVDLKAAALPEQRVQVILPITKGKENEVYAPNYPNGTTLALVRYPHTGAFEIPIVKVNNNNPEAQSFLKDSRGEALDAIGIHPKTAQILSGADFDGDTVTCIPMTRLNSQGEFEKTVNIKGIGNGQHKLPGLEGFSPSDAYPYREGMKVMDSRTKGIEMGVVSNLITDMQLKGGVTDNELERAVKYSMVVIDAEKHKLDYTKAEKDYNIQELKDKYQSNADGTHGTSTLISRAGSEKSVSQRENWSPDKKWIDPDTGELVSAINPQTGEKNFKVVSDRFYNEKTEVKKLASPEYKAEHPNAKYEKDESGNYVYETYTDKNGKERVRYQETGKVKERTTKTTKMADAKDAYELLSDNPSNKEILYADYANKMKSMANESRKEYLSVPKLEYSPEARKKYADEVNSLDDKLIEAKKNAPRERDAQRLATSNINARLEANPDMSKEEVKRVKGQALLSARAAVGAKKERVVFTDKEWEAINAGAISESKLKELLRNADSDSYKSLALPKSSRVSNATATRINSLLNAGWTREEIVNAGYASMDTIKEVQAGNYERS